MAKAPTRTPSIEKLLAGGSSEWNKLRKSGQVPTEHIGATFENLFSANADLSGLGLVGSEWDRCDLSRVTFRDTDLSNAYFHGGRLQDCDFRGANLEGATFERLKLLRCDFTGAQGLDSLELEDVDMDRVTGLDGEEAPPPPPPPAQGVTSFTREQRAQVMGSASPTQEDAANELPPFRPQDSAAQLLSRGLRKLQVPPPWVLDVPGLRPLLPSKLTPGSALESLYREAVKNRLEGRPTHPDQDAVKRSQQSLRLGSKDAAHAAMYLREVGIAPLFRFSAAKVLKEQLRAEVDVDDPTAQIDPRITGALLELKLPHEISEHLGEARKRLAAAQLFTSLLEAGFVPENNWDEALESAEPALDLAHTAHGDDRQALLESFQAFAGLPDEVRLRRLGYLAEAAAHLELISRLPPGTEPEWITGPESRECHDREMTLVGTIKGVEIPSTVPELAQTELGIPVGTVPEDSENDLFVHLRCAECGKERLLMQSPSDGSEE